MMPRFCIAEPLLVHKCLVLLMLLSLVAAECPCTHCGPPMCKAVCVQDCYKCCECCVFFENRVGKRSTNERQEDKQESLCLFKRHLQSKTGKNKQQLPLPDMGDIAEAMSLRMSILQDTEDRLNQADARSSAGLDKFLNLLRQASSKSRET